MTRHHQDAEDLTQQTFLKAHNYLPRFDPQRPFITWVLTIARNTALNHFRDTKKWEEIPEDTASGGLVARPPRGAQGAEGQPLGPRPRAARPARIRGALAPLRRGSFQQRSRQRGGFDRDARQGIGLPCPADPDERSESSHEQPPSPTIPASPAAWRAARSLILGDNSHRRSRAARARATWPACEDCQVHFAACDEFDLALQCDALVIGARHPRLRWSQTSCVRRPAGGSTGAAQCGAADGFGARWRIRMCDRSGGVFPAAGYLDYGAATGRPNPAKRGQLA
jgi:RNA polymerase sigma factor (sigma-70 family)